MGKDYETTLSEEANIVEVLVICPSEQSSSGITNADSNGSNIVTFLAREKYIRRDTHIPPFDYQTI